jgi:GrpB-like predicted nucleotidyltransferase (UPF0157 family)
MTATGSAPAKLDWAELDCARFDWAELFAAEAGVVREALGSRAVAVEHVGSTAVPGLGGKPVLDLLVGLASPLTSADTHALKCAGYRHLRARRDGRLVFRKGSPRGYSLHVTEHGSVRWRDVIGFRDYLRAHPAAAEEYRELTRALARQRPSGYAAGKRAFVTKALQRAAFSAAPLDERWPTPGVEPSEH